MGDNKRKSLSEILAAGLEEVLDIVSERAGEKLDELGDRLQAFGEKLGEKLEIKFGDSVPESDDSLNLQRLRDVTAAARRSAGWGISSVPAALQLCAEAVEAAAHKGFYGTQVHVKISPNVAKTVVEELNIALGKKYRRVLISYEGIASTEEFTHTIFIDWADIP
jgi:hypothetical protein